MKLEMNDIIDKHKNEKCIIVASGPSLNDYLDKIKELSVTYKIIACNNWFNFLFDVVPNYWVMANSMENCNFFINQIIRYKTTILYADSVDLIDQQLLDNQIQSDYLPYDQRHFKGMKCESCETFGCNRYRNEKRLTIQEELQKYSGYKKHYSAGCTVALHMIAFAIIMGFSEIFITGMDLNYRMGYANNNNNNQPNIDVSNFDFDRYGKYIIEDLEIIKKSCENIGVKIYNTNKDSFWKVFEYRSLVDKGDY